ncbi:MAG: Hsp20/alpha crystallin family protein [Candidatus Methanoperedens sp.]
MVEQWDDFRRFEEMMNRMFEEFLGRPGRRRLLPSGERGAVVPAEYREPFIDVIETDKEVIATAEMPGLEKQDIKINVTEDRLEISAETKHEEKKEEKGYVYRERRSGSYYRAISLPSPVDPDKSKASYKNGVLEIKMPKTEVKKKTPLKIE